MVYNKLTAVFRGYKIIICGEVGLSVEYSYRRVIVCVFACGRGIGIFASEFALNGVPRQKARIAGRTYNGIGINSVVGSAVSNVFLFAFYVYGTLIYCKRIIGVRINTRLLAVNYNFDRILACFLDNAVKTYGVGRPAVVAGRRQLGSAFGRYVSGNTPFQRNRGNHVENGRFEMQFGR